MTTEERAETPSPRYYIDTEGECARRRSIPLMVAERRCYQCRQADEGEGLPSAEDLPGLLQTIVDHCKDTPDYLAADTPLKEAIFRVLLASGNQPMTAAEVAKVLQEEWAMTPYPRNLAPEVLQRLMDHSPLYCITRVEEEEEEAQEDGEPQEGSS